MTKLSFKLREKKNENLKDFVPGILYGPGIDNIKVDVDFIGLEKLYKETGGSSLISLHNSENSEKKEYKVLIHDVQRDPLSEKIIHVDFYQPNLKEEVEVTIPLVFEGEPPAVKELGGTFVKNILEIEIKALPEKLLHDIKVDVSNLKTFDDAVLIKDLKIPEGVEILKDPEETVAFVAPIQDVEEELEKPIEEDVDSVEKVEGKKKEVVEEDESEDVEEKKEKE